MKLHRTSPTISAIIAILAAGVIGIAGCASQPGGSIGGSSERDRTLPVDSALKKSARLQTWRDAEWLAEQGEGRTSLVGAGESMAPVYGASTMLVITAIPYRELIAGMNVAYRSSEGHRVVHQLIEQTPDGWRAQGLNNGFEDRERVTAENLIGVIYASLEATVQ